jgi:hypothetical protein
MWVTSEQLVGDHGYDITKLEVEEFNGWLEVQGLM